MEGKGCFPIVENDSSLKVLTGDSSQLEQSLGIVPVDACTGLDLDTPDFLSGLDQFTANCNMKARLIATCAHECSL